MTLGLLLLAVLLPGTAMAETMIQIGVVHRARTLTLVPEGRFTIVDTKDGMRGELESGQDYILERAGYRSMRLGVIKLSSEAKLTPSSSRDSVTIGRKRYRGNFTLKLNADGTVTVIDEMAIDDYLLGVLPYEMDPSWPLEALKAQAVVARTFAYAQLGKFRKSGFDLTSDTRSQVYGGLSKISDSVRWAVSQTKGEVLGYKGKLLPVYYHSCCGGHTTSPAAVWGPAGPTPVPLRGVKDRYCVLSPYRKWKAFFSADDVRAAVMDRRLVGGKLKWIRPVKKDPAGYVRLFRARVGIDDIMVKAIDLRRRLGNSQLRSVKILKVKRTRGGFKFTGRGSGHGVGLCQWGSRIQAEKGRPYEKILAFYFPQSVLSLLDE